MEMEKILTIIINRYYDNKLAERSEAKKNPNNYVKLFD